MNHYYLAIDIGASSGRHILGHREQDRLVLEEIYRFDNRQIRRNGHDCWDLENLWNGIVSGLKACKTAGKIPETIGIDTWGVDFVLLDADGNMLGDAVAYRDSRTEHMVETAEALVPADEIYRKTGIQKNAINTLYQLLALKQEHPEQLEKAERLLMIPDYLNYRLTGVCCNEYTDASTSNLLNAQDKQWDLALIRKLGLPEKIFFPLTMPGAEVGPLSEEMAAQVGFQTRVVLPAAHDTGSAFLAVPAKEAGAVYLSSGTWSLLGMENPDPITTEESCRQNFTNEGGAWGRYRFLKNIMGLWMIQSVRRELNGVSYVQGSQQRQKQEKQWSFPDLIGEAEKYSDFPSVVDVNKPCFLAPDSMIRAIQDECAASGQPVPQAVGQIMQCIYTSLSLCYRDAIAGLSRITGTRFTCIHIVGGGCQDRYLNRCTARATGLPVLAGPVEGTAIGNLMVQMISSGEFASLEDAREAVRRSFSVVEILP